MATATVTGKTGAGLSMTAVTFNNVMSFTVNTASKMLRLVDNSDVVTDISIAAATTFTVTITAGLYSITIS